MCKSLTIFFNLIFKHWNLFKTPFEFLWQFCFNRWFWSLLVLSYFVVGNDYVKPKSYSWHCECLSFHGPLGHQLITHGYLSNRPTASVIHQNMIIYTEKQLSKSVLFFFFFFGLIADLRFLFCLSTYRDRFEYYIRLSEIGFLCLTIIKERLLRKYS